MAKFVLPYETPILSSLYSLGEQLAEGPYGATYLCIDKSTGDEYACKSIAKSSANSTTTRRARNNSDDAWREIQVMHRLSRLPSVVAFRDAYEDSDHVHLVTELCHGGDLFDRVLTNARYCERDALRLIKTVLEFVESCHSLGVVHRDLKPRSLMFSCTDPDSQLKVVDVGSAVFFRRGDSFRETVGSPYYVAPEVLKKKYGPEADVWSAGVILYILLSGIPPFWAETKKETYNEILNGTLDLESQPWSDDISDDAKDLLRKMLDKDPRKRLSAYYVLCHPWMADESNAPDIPLDSTRLRLKQFLEMNELD